MDGHVLQGALILSLPSSEMASNAEGVLSFWNLSSLAIHVLPFFIVSLGLTSLSIKVQGEGLFEGCS